MSSTVTKLDSNQAIRKSYSDADEALRVLPISGNLVPEKYDEIDLTYVAAGNGVGEIETVTYSLSGNVIATLTLSYNSDNKLIKVERT